MLKERRRARLGDRSSHRWTNSERLDVPLCDAAPSVVDPTGAELAALAEIVDFSGLRVLEIGCGTGRLTWRYAGPAREVLGIDPDEEAIATARAATPPKLRQRVRFDIASPIERVVPRRHFDLAFFSWSL
jgi:2-polyprenyl-3-methyl-5-hydroxy-6-metoxy-1,4-benzoquinol methylase